MNVIGMLFQISKVTNRVLPKATLPDATTSFANF